MVEKIENLAQASEDSSSETVSGLVKKKRVKEQELRKTLEQLELVASQIEEAADTADSIEEVDTIEKIAKLLQSISNKVEANNEDEDDDEEVFRRQFAKDQSQTGLELNGIAEMIKSLEKVTKDLTEDDEDDSEDEDDSSRRAQKLVDDVKSGKLGRGSRGRGQKARGGKQIDLGLESDKGSLDSTANRSITNIYHHSMAESKAIWFWGVNLCSGFWMFLTWRILRRQTRAVEVRKALGEGAASLRSLRTAKSAKEKLPRTVSASASPSQLRKEHL